MELGRFVGHADVDLAVEAAEAAERRVHGVGAVRRARRCRSRGRSGRSGGAPGPWSWGGSSGTPMSISRSKRPKRRSAGSMELGRFVGHADVDLAVEAAEAAERRVHGAG